MKIIAIALAAATLSFAAPAMAAQASGQTGTVHTSVAPTNLNHDEVSSQHRHGHQHRHWHRRHHWHGHRHWHHRHCWWRHGHRVCR